MRKKHGLRPHEQRAREQADNAGMQTGPKQGGEPQEQSPPKRTGKRQGKK